VFESIREEELTRIEVGRHLDFLLALEKFTIRCLINKPRGISAPPDRLHCGHQHGELPAALSRNDLQELSTMPFAQLVVGPPGSGKSTYCDGMHQFMSAIGRKCSVVNLDPANDKTSYPCALDVRDLVTLEEIMEQDELGPNGGVLYALEELEHNLEWLDEELKKLGGGLPLNSSFQW
jgi:hypothetical protein